DGGFITSNFSPRNGDAAARARMMAGENNGEVWEWHTTTGWKIVPGSESAGPNGLEISKDAKWLYIGGWVSQSFIRLSRGQTPVKKDSVPVGFRVDNLRWAPDGTLLAAGQGGTAPSQTSNVVKVDPATLKFQELVRSPSIEGFGVTTVAILSRLLMLHGSRSDRLGEHRPSTGTEHMPPGRALYRKGLTREKTAESVRQHPAKKTDVYGTHTGLQRRGAEVAARRYP